MDISAIDYNHLSFHIVSYSRVGRGLTTSLFYEEPLYIAHPAPSPALFFEILRYNNVDRNGVNKQNTHIHTHAHTHTHTHTHTRALVRKLKLTRFSQNWEIRLVFTKSPHHGWRQSLLQPKERWKTPFWERNISEQDIIQITTEKCFFLCLS